MSSEIGFIVVLAVLALAVLVGVWRWRTDGRLRTARPEFLPGVPVGNRATFVQFSSKICSPCAATRRLLGDVAELDGVEYVDLDVEEHMELVRHFSVTRTPTTLVLDGHGTVRHRIVGVPRRGQIDHVIEASPIPTRRNDERH